MAIRGSWYIYRCSDIYFNNALAELWHINLNFRKQILSTEAAKSAAPEELHVIVNLISKYRERYTEVGYCESAIYPGVERAFQTLCERGVRMGVCTSKRKDFAEKILLMFGLLPLLSFVDGGEVGIKKREQLAGLLQDGNNNHSAGLIGNRAVDISDAKPIGLRTVGVLWGFGTESEPEKAGADSILCRTNELRLLAL